MQAAPQFEKIAPPSRIHQAPVVSSNSDSPEAIMARNSKTIELQLVADTQYDPVVRYESFKDINQTLLLLSIATVFISIICCTH
jgi:hypothetical protein